MKKSKIISALLLSFSVSYPIEAAPAKWSFLTYMQADNNLSPFATYNFKDMQKVGSTNDVNILVQWDKPETRATHRYKVLQNNMVVNSSTSQEMGLSPAKEIVDAMKWVQNTYPAEQYGLVLWNHGNGVLDRGGAMPLLAAPWLIIPGLKSRYIQKERGILYDYSQNTFLDNPGLTSVCNQIKTLLKKNLDFLGMDACLMAMIEVAYQVKDSVNYLIASQQTESGKGWPYSSILSSLIGVPTMTEAELGNATVQAYADFYSTGSDADPSFTLSSINVSKIPAAVNAFNSVLGAIKQMQLLDKAGTNAALKRARTNTLEFYIPDYIDLINFYDNLSKELSVIAGGRPKKSTLPRDTNVKKATSATLTAITAARAAAIDSITASQAGTDNNNSAFGLSIYFPADGRVSSSYRKTLFAQQTSWVSILTSLR